jgi:hypothetical protein
LTFIQCAGVHASQLLHREVSDEAFDLSGSQQFIIMKNHDMAISGLMHIQLYGVTACFDGFPECQHGIFGVDLAVASMGDIPDHNGSLISDVLLTLTLYQIPAEECAQNHGQSA